MNLTNDDFKKIEKALDLLPKGKAFDRLTEEKQKIIVDATVTMVNLLKKKRKVNERTKNYINEKRKTNKNYARTPYIKKADREAEKETGKKTKRNKKTK